MPARVRLQRGKKLPPNTRSVARPSRWGNPVKIGDDISHYLPDCTRATAKDAVAFFRTLCEADQAADPDKFAAWLAPLRGFDLACYCAPTAPCHADVLLELANA